MNEHICVALKDTAKALMIIHYKEDNYLHCADEYVCLN